MTPVEVDTIWFPNCLLPLDFSVKDWPRRRAPASMKEEGVERERYGAYSNKVYFSVAQSVWATETLPMKFFRENAFTYQLKKKINHATVEFCPQFSCLHNFYANNLLLCYS
jgi:hypothetical protein